MLENMNLYRVGNETFELINDTRMLHSVLVHDNFMKGL